MSKIRWNSFFYEASRLYALNNSNIQVCQQQDWPITFAWCDVALAIELLKPIAVATTYLEGDSYPAPSSVIPSLLTLQDHFIDSQKTFSGFQEVTKKLLNELNRKFDHILNVLKILNEINTLPKHI